MNHIKVSVLIVLAMAASIAHASEGQCVPAKHAKLPPLAELTYHKARKALLASGWQPLQTKSFNQAMDDPDISSGNGRIFWEQGYVEVEGCAGTGVAACAFLLKDVYDNRLRVTTAGEEYPKDKVFAVVTGAQFVCE